MLTIRGLPRALSGLQHAGFVGLGPLTSPSNALLHNSASAYKAEGNEVSGPPTPPEEIGVGKQVKYGVNTPHNIKEFGVEAGKAAVGIGESIVEGVQATATAIKRSLGMTSEKPMSESLGHGAGGKMQHAPPGSKDGGASVDREHADAKYQEISETEKNDFPAGQQSVSEQYPDQAEAAKLQNLGGHKSDVKLDKNLHEMGP